MTIHNIEVTWCDYHEQFKCKATIQSTDYRYINNILYYSKDSEWVSDYHTLSDNQKKMCRREWYKMAKTLGINRKELNIII